tara:strand:- start:96074 stop:97096 length:1023 start_codon:yes stop_codon:yes gene_type:complete
MEAWLHSNLDALPLIALLGIFAIALYVLAKGADLLVEEAVTLSKAWGVPTVIIGATIVSLGTTLPEAAVSVMAAIGGNPDLALGNAVGSIITDCGLILGLAAVISPLPLQKSVVNRQGWIQIGAGVLLVLLCVPWSAPGTAWSTGGTLAQWEGFVLVGLLIVYLVGSVIGARGSSIATEVPDVDEKKPTWHVLALLCFGIFLVVGSSHVLIPTIEVIALDLGIPQAIIAATLVAFGTSLPELVTALNAVRRGHGELAVGNVIGADILNVLFVAGLSAAVTPNGLNADPRFFRLLFPGMLILLVIFRVGIWVEKEKLGRSFGIILLVGYAGTTLSSYLLEG